MARTPSAALLLIVATAVAAVSFFFHNIAPANSLTSEVVLGYVPFLLGFVSMFLCVQAIKRTPHKPLATVYTVLLSPFAFSYPAWILILWVLYRTLGAGSNVAWP